MLHIQKKSFSRGLVRVLSLLLLICSCHVLTHAQINVTGQLLIEGENEPLMGANVILKGTTVGTVTDLDGHYEITVPNEEAVLEFGFIGFVTKTVKVGNQTVINVFLAEDSQMLDEVVVTALGIKREEKSLGYASQKIKGETFSKVKGVEVASSLTGKISGVSVMNKTDFNKSPVIYLRGEKPLLVIDGVPYQNLDLRDIAPDDIEDLTVLKGATASALYGTKGSNGAIMVTTKRGQKEGLEISANSSTMFEAGYLRLPKVHHAYSSGSGGKYNADDDVWGDRLDIGRTALQHNPETYQWEERELTSVGKNNFKNFLQQALVTKNNVSVAYKGANGSFRTSLSHTYNRGAFPNNSLKRYNYNVSGDMKFGKLTIDAGMTYNNSNSPQTRGVGYDAGQAGPIYTILVWTATNYDLTKYRDYWVNGKEGQQQNWLYKRWYNNPYFSQYESTDQFNKHLVNGHANVTYELLDGVKVMAKVGADAYAERQEQRRPQSMVGQLNGKYGVRSNIGSSITSDLMLLADKRAGEFDFSGIAGVGSNYYIDQHHLSNTEGGLVIPSYYSLNASVNNASTSERVHKRLINSVYGRLSVGWKSAIYLEATGRNDWVSTLSSDQRSFFYPSLSSSIIGSEFLKEYLPNWFNFWKVRGSWTVTKMAAAPFKINNIYDIDVREWDGTSSAAPPSVLYPTNLRPEKSETFEVGTDFRFFDNRVRFDFTYYSKLLSDLHKDADVSQASGYKKVKVNYGEEQMRRGLELTLGMDLIKRKDLQWTSTVNWSRERRVFTKIDPIYSPQNKPWIAVGKRSDYVDIRTWEKDSQGNVVHGSNGMPRRDTKLSVIGYESPDWYWGLSNDLRYRNVTLTVTFDGRVGGIAFNKTEQALWHGGGHIDSDTEWRKEEVVNNNRTFIGEGVKLVAGEIKYAPNGDVISDTREFAPNDIVASYQAYMKAFKGGWPNHTAARPGNYEVTTFFKLRELAIGYTFPQTMVEKIGLNDAHIALVGQNLLLWTKQFKNSDPDGLEGYKAEDLSAPSVRYLGVNLKFSF